MISERHCLRCKKETTQEVHKCITRSNSESYGWRCQLCNWWVPRKGGGIWINRGELLEQGIDTEALPVIVELGERCAVCGRRGTEEHHWMPQALAGKERADKWPKDWLCKEHHDEWHRTVTPTLCGYSD